MNILAHCLLSDQKPGLLAGNFLGDFVRKKDVDLFPLSIQQGVWLHQKIDYYTDRNEWAKKSRDRLAPVHRHYARVVVDIIYDYILTCHWDRFGPEPLENFANHVYEMLEDYKEFMPKQAHKTYIAMRNNNWLVNYRYLSGIRRALQGMDHRSHFASNMERAADQLLSEYKDFENDFLNFFPTLIETKNDFLKEQNNASQ